MVSDVGSSTGGFRGDSVSIRFEVRGGFRLSLFGGVLGFSRFQSALRFAVVSDTAYWENGKIHMFQSALRFAVVSDPSVRASLLNVMFQSALRFAVVSDALCLRCGALAAVSIHFEVRGGFRPPQRCSGPTSTSCFNPL